MLTVVWKALLSLESSWEIAACQVVEGRVQRATLGKVGDPAADLYLLAYPASAHAEVVRADLVRGALNEVHGQTSPRLGLVACDRAVPDVELSAVAEVLDVQARGFQMRHPARAETVASLEEKVEEWLRLTAFHLGMSPLASSIAPPGGAQVSVGGEEERWRKHLF